MPMPATWFHLATMHRAKGLEFDCVMVVAPESYLGLAEETEAQRKLLYVALTRRSAGRRRCRFEKTCRHFQDGLPVPLASSFQ